MTREEFEAKTEEWHNETDDWYDSNGIELHEYMGISWEEYCKYVEEGFDE